MDIPGITIEDIHLQLQKYIEDKVQVVMTLRNHSKTLTYYMLRRPRTIEYDKGTRTLLIGLYEKELAVGRDLSFRPSEPEQIAISPDTILPWQYVVPVWMKKITRSPGTREKVEVFNIYGIQQVVCTVAYHPHPFRLKPDDEGGDMLAALSKWGQTVSARFERTITAGLYLQ
jgi:hypothetical protein